MKGIGIKYQLRLTTLLPALLLAILFALFYNGQYAKDLKQHLQRLGEAYIHQLLPVAQLAILNGDHRTLQGLIDASTNNPEVQTLAFYNASGQLLAYHGGKHALNTLFKPPAFTGDYIESKQKDAYTIHFIAPITQPKFNLYAADNHTPNAISLQTEDILGWLAIDIDTKSMLIKRYQMYIVTIFITLIGLLMSLSIHYFLSKRIYLPITRLRRSMKQILSNEFETKIKTTSAGELGMIEAGCAHMQRRYLDTIEDLNQHIEVATADLQQSLELLEEKNIELSLDKKKAEERNRQKSELMANMSHEIRTPMNGVLGFTNVLLESNLNPLQMDYVKTIKSSAQDLLGIINDILDYSKMDAGKLHLDCIPVDIRACIDEVLALAAPNAHKKGLDLIPITNINVPKILLGDPLRIKQLISNLISNAVKFTESGYVLIRTNVQQESEKDYSIALSVTDTGIGISPDDQATLFNAFNQADTTIARRYGGSGLGLVICKKLAEHMHGRISLSSELNKGSVFTVHIKLEKLAAYEIEKYQAQRFSGLKVLCFDDHPLHLEAISNGLAYFGIDCIRINTFADLKQALSIHKDCDLAFISVNHGCEEQVSKLLADHHRPTVLVSKFPIEDYQHLGAQGFLFKPPNIQKLHDTIESLLNQVTLTKSNREELGELRAAFRSTSPALLIAEDNPVNRMLLSSMLKNHATIEMVADGEEANELANHRPFHAILLDLQMPKRNGLECAKMIRKQSKLNQHTPIVLISANHPDLKQRTLSQLGIAACLQKPIDEETLLRTLLDAINKANIPAINWPLCVQKLSGNETLAAEFLAKFIEDLENSREEFIILLKNEDLHGLEQMAHRVHGACCFCGVPHLQHHIARFEKLAKNTQHISELQAAFEALLKSIDAVLTEYQQIYRLETI